MIDLHTHILPAIDDGAENTNVSFQMLEKEISQGVEAIVFTPHYYGRKDSPERFLEKRKKAFSQLQERVEKMGLTFRLGAEVYFDEDRAASNSALSKLAIEGTKYILLELPWHNNWSESLWRGIDCFIADTGLTPIIAHVERYAEIRKNPSYLSLLADLGCLLQVNTGAFLSEKTSGMATAMLKKGLVHCLGTDAHNLTDRTPDYEAAKAFFTKIGERDRFEVIQRNMQSILSGEKLRVPAYQSLKKFLNKYY